jgi:tRNA(fMet)-specific endonuclease VapC
MKYMLDTNICIYIIKKKSGNVLAKIKANRGNGLAISSITLAELWHGVEYSASREKNTIALIEFLAIVKIMSFDDKAAEEYGRVKADLQRRKCLIGPLDTLIAAHAKSNGMVIVTNNTKEFSRVEGLKVEDWTK